jgi:LacI family transcriptional regulator
MGYAPLAHAQAIRTGRVRALGIVLQVGEHDAQRPFLADFLAGLTTAASAESWTLTVATAPTEAQGLDTMRRLIDERKADGFILPRTKTDDPRVELLRSENVPFVLWGRTGDPAGCAWFDILGEDAMAEAVVRLHDMGHRRIGYIGGGGGFHYSLLRHDGYRGALEGVGLDHDPGIVGHGAVTAEDGAVAGRRLLSNPRPPTAIVCATDMAALGVYRAVSETGLLVGRDVSVIAYDGIPEGAYAAPPLTTFEVDSREAGSRLAELLIRRIRGEAPEELRETAHARLRVRSSDGPPGRTSEELREHFSRVVEQV